MPIILTLFLKIFYQIVYRVNPRVYALIKANSVRKFFKIFAFAFITMTKYLTSKALSIKHFI